MAKRPKVSTSDRDILKPRRSGPDSTVDLDDGPPPGDIPDLGTTVDQLIAYNNAVTRAFLDGAFDEKKHDTLIAMGRHHGRTIAQRDAKNEERELEQMLEDAKRVNAEGLQTEAGDRHHSRRVDGPKTTADAEDEDVDAE